jgi:hypothetical protein
MTSHIAPETYPDPVKECWAVHQALRMLGFSSDDIYVVHGASADFPGHPPTMFVVLQTQGLEFVIHLGACKTDAEVESLLDLWTEFVERWNRGDFAQSDMQKIYDASNAMQNKIQLVVGLKLKGFSIPAITN